MLSTNLSYDKDMVVRFTVDSLLGSTKFLYLVGSKEVAKTLFKNAQVIPFVKWYQIPDVFLQFVKDDSLQINEHNFKRFSNARDLLKPVFDQCYTVLPFTPVKDNFSDVDSWRVNSDILEKNFSVRTTYRYTKQEIKSFLAVLLENGNAMSFILNGAYYDTPCQFCQHMFSRIAGTCEIYNTDKYATQTCQPRISFDSQLFLTDETTKEDATYAKELIRDSLVIEEALLEV